MFLRGKVNMKPAGKLAAVILTASLTLSMAGTSAPLRAAAAVPGPCYLPARAGETIRHRMKRTIACAVGLWSVPGRATKAICIANRESHLNPNASSATGKYLGLFQHSAKAWPSRYRSYSRPRWDLAKSALNGRTNAVVTIRMVHAAGRHGWRPWSGLGC